MFHSPWWVKVMITKEWFAAIRNGAPETDLLAQLPLHAFRRIATDDVVFGVGQVFNLVRFGDES